MRSLGIDVAVDHLDLVCVEEHYLIRDIARVAPDDLMPYIVALGPDIVAVDSPPQWAREGSSRQAERELSRLGIQSYRTPGDPARQKNRFYDWMRCGFEVFRMVASLGYPRYAAGAPSHCAIEIFPHASAVALAGCLRPRGLRKRWWRSGLLKRLGIEDPRLANQDRIDAALAAVTGLYALEGIFVAIGEPAEGVVVLPVSRVPERYAPGRIIQRVRGDR